VGKEEEKYWNQVDLYIGGAEHATGHLLYSRFWNKFLYDLGYVTSEEPFKKLINQGMIQGRSNFVYRINGSHKFVSFGLKKDFDTTPLHVDVNIVHNDILDLEAFRKWRPDFVNAEFILEDGKYYCGHEVEKMSKRWYNVVNPDDVVNEHGADTLRLYEMFLGPLEQFKPWNTQGIEGVHKFLRKLWRLFYDEKGLLKVNNDEPTAEEYKALHQTIKKVEEDIERFSFNTSVSTFMICVNTLSDLKCSKRGILENLIIVLSPYAPHIAEELWKILGHSESITYAKYPQWEEKYLVENTFEYPISINGKLRTKMEFSVDTTPAEIEKAVMESEQVQKWLEGKTPKKIIVVPRRIVNLVM
jgi:leucyl-tRNA synthetase